MAKRKRDATEEQQVKVTKSKKTTNVSNPDSNTRSHPEQNTVTLQIVVGSYERALHGFAATLPTNRASAPKDSENDKEKAKFTDTFLFNAHSSAIRCIAISPPSGDDNSKVILASGSTDERINLYQLSTSPPILHEKASLPSLSGVSASENPRNREVGSLLHHSSSITCLYFPTKSKLLSASEDNTVAVARTRDWTVMSTIKAPIPKAIGRPSGDTAAPGEVPAGVNAFAVHPSMKLMLTIGKGERCMRLWNLVTGRKAAVLNFDRDTLKQAGEGRYASGEGRKVEWDEEGEEYTVAFERGAVVYGLDSKPRGLISLSPRSKIHQIRYVPGTKQTMLATSTEDGRILFFATQVTRQSSGAETKASDIPLCSLVAQLGGRAAGIAGRIKDFEIVTLHGSESSSKDYCIIAGSSDGAVRLWTVDQKDLESKQVQDKREEEVNGNGEQKGTSTVQEVSQVGSLLGTYETGHRITCLKAFIMTGKPVDPHANREESVAVSDDGSSDSE